MKTNKQIQEAEIQEALRKFQERGGLIRILTSEKTPLLNLVGRKYGQFENLFEHHFGPETFFTSY